MPYIYEKLNENGIDANRKRGMRKMTHKNHPDGFFCLKDIVYILKNKNNSMNHIKVVPKGQNDLSIYMERS